MLNKIIKMARKVNILTKRGQLTIFLIMGILIVMVFMFTYFILAGTSKQKLESEAQEVIETGLQRGAFQFLVEECTKDVLKEGLYLIGQHGGNVVPGAVSKENAAYLIYEAAFDLSKYGGYTGERMLFGNNRMPSLSTIEKALEKHVAENIKGCVDFESEEWQGMFAGYDIVEGDVTVDVRFAGNMVTASIDYPIVINPGEEESMLLKEWKVTIQPFAFKVFYEILTENLGLEVIDEKYNLTAGLEEEGITSQRIDFADGDYIMRLTDNRLIIDGENYVFQFAVKNRPPVLYDLGEVVVSNVAELPNIEIKAVDPDGDEVTILERLKAIPAQAQSVTVTDGHYIVSQAVSIRVTG
jgi:hypothetical protein